MKQDYFVVVLAHSLRGRLRRIHIPHHAIYAVLALALLGCFSVLGFVASYARMAWKVANYNALKQEADTLRLRYQTLLKSVNQTNDQLASMQLYAREVSLAYGLKEKIGGPADLSSEGRLMPSLAESFEDFDYLRHVRALGLPSRNSRRLLPIVARPSIWPVEGRLLGSFGHRTDPFSGEGAFHKGVDISAPSGTPVHSTADGTVIFAGWEGGFGHLVVVDHGNGIQTYYAHLSQVNVHVGQDLRRGDAVGAVGTTGRTTAPHLHYEVHQAGSPVNPYSYHLAKADVNQPAPQQPNYLLF
jgi:murein DD-endopeptidase MepM/ murein hydrolase activator NlpD